MGGGKPKDLGPAIPARCSRCGREDFARYLSVTKWFRLYFIPLIPYQTKHFLVCPVCTAATELTTRDERAQAERLVSLTASMLAGMTDEDTYRRLLAAELNGAAQSQQLPPMPPPRKPEPSAVDETARAIRGGGGWAA